MLNHAWKTPSSLLSLRLNLHKQRLTTAQRVLCPVRVCAQRSLYFGLERLELAIGRFTFVLRAMSPGALSHFLTVFLASPPHLHISSSESWSHSFMRRTLPIMSMVITFYIPAEGFSRAVEHPCQIWIGNLDLRLLIFGRRRQT